MMGFALSGDQGQLASTNHRLGSFCLQSSPEIPVTKLLDTSGKVCGLILGWAIDLAAGKMLSGTASCQFEGDSIDALYRSEIRPLAGTYLAILQHGDDTRIYLDGLGNLSLVFDPERGIAASSASFIMDNAEYAERFDKALYTAMEIAKEGWFPAGLTAHRGLERLMVNHYLDCESWSQHRHNSYDAAGDFADDPDRQLAKISGEIEGTIAAMIASGRAVTLGLTGGGDSRMLLACAKRHAHRMETYTVGPPASDQQSFDVIRARELAAKFGLKHQVLPFVRATDEEARDWDRQVGDCVITANRKMHPSVYPLEHHLCIGGLGGEVGRCFLWNDPHNLPATDATNLVDLLKLPRHPVVIERVEKWRAALPAMDATRLLDLAYIELRMGSWSSVQSYANPRSVIIHPLASFNVIEAMLQLPPEFRENDGMVRALIARNWPELLDLPINRFGDWRDIKQPFAKVLNPTKVFRKLRQLIRVR